jgi:long-chain acyl-CoA synthetase
LLSYHEQPDETARVLTGSRLRTGDLGSLDDDGYLYVADRRTDMINRGGSKVSPVEVERVLLQHPEVADCIVVGRPSTRLGESVAAVVQGRVGSDLAIEDLRAHCAVSLARYKVPADLVVVSELPRNSMGKVIRSVVRERLVEGLLETDSENASRAGAGDMAPATVEGE